MKRYVQISFLIWQKHGDTIYKERGNINMGSFGGFYKGDKKKPKKGQLEKKAQKQLSGSGWQLPQVDIIKKGKKEDW